MATRKLADISRNLTTQAEKPSNELYMLSAAVRTVDAAEAMATNYANMQKDLSWYMGQYHAQKTQIEKLKGTITALKGQVTKAKKAAR